jgi:hypothetical protein
VDANVPRVDLVSIPANGSTGFLLMKQDAQAGLMPPDAIRELIGKTAAEPTPEETVTLAGSPAAIAKLIHQAAVRAGARDREPVAKAKYDADDLKRMAANGEAMDDESYPIADREDLDDAIRAVGRGGADHDAIRRHVITRARALGAASEIPDNWNKDGSLKGDVAKEMDMDDEPLDVMTALAESDGEHAGMDTDPGSPAWEAVDAATACKWTAILARARNAVDMLAEREMLEAAAGDQGDAGNAFDLQDACCAIDYAISVLAPFAVAEQAEADCGDDMQMVGKALAALDPAGLDTIEAFASVTKAGRVLSSANEQAIRGAVESLQKVLASLPAAPTAPVEKEAGQPVPTEETHMPEPTTSAETVADHGETPTMGVAKADGEKTPMVVVYDQKGRLIGIVDPGDVTPVANAEADADDMDEAAPDDSDNADADAGDLTPQPPADAGTPADAPADTTPDDLAKSTTTAQDILKSIAAQLDARFDTHSATQEQAVAKQADDLAQLAKTVSDLGELVKALGEQPAAPKVFTNGATPPAAVLRGQDQGAPPVDLARAQELKKGLYRGATAGEQNAIANEMQGMAIARLQQLHHGGSAE